MQFMRSLLLFSFCPANKFACASSIHYHQTFHDIPINDVSLSATSELPTNSMLVRIQKTYMSDLCWGYVISFRYSRINSIKSPPRGAGNVSLPRLMSQDGKVGEIVCAPIIVFRQSEQWRCQIACFRSSCSYVTEVGGP